MTAYFPALWFNDSFTYVRIGLAPFPHPVRPAGYAVLLWALRPFHSFAAVVALQHLMGLGTAIMIYALVHHRYGRPRWAGILATVPVLFDAYQLELEQLIMSDVLFTFLLTAATTVTLWRPAITWRSGVAIGVLLAVATLTRTVSLPLILVVVGFLIVRHASWRAVGATTIAATLPIGAYALWFQAWNGTFALTNTDGVFLWGRTAAFADCAKIKPPADLASMCPRGTPGRRPESASQIWQPGSPTGWSTYHTFTASTNDRARRFALRAIIAQPLDYGAAAGRGLARTFDWKRRTYPTASTFRLYRFPGDAARMPAAPILNGAEPRAVRDYSGQRSAARISEPYAGWLRGYQRVVFLRGPMLAAILVVGLISLLRRTRDGALVWVTATCLLTVPLLTTDFDYRYVLPAVPFACAAAALATRRLPADVCSPEPPVGRTRRLPETDRGVSR